MKEIKKFERYSNEKIIKTKGYIPHHERKSCGECKYMEYVGTGSRKQQTTYCTKITPNFIISVDDICDEFEEK